MVAYEVRCHRCDVSFPAGTKVCLHCGGKTGQSEASVRPDDLSLSGLADEDQLTLSGGGLGESPAGHDAESVRRSLLGSAMSLFWVMLLIAAYLFRSCGS